METLLRASELAEHLSVTPETVRRWTRQGAIPFHRVGQSKRYSLTAVLAAIETRSPQ